MRYHCKYFYFVNVFHIEHIIVSANICTFVANFSLNDIHISERFGKSLTMSLKCFLVPTLSFGFQFVRIYGIIFVNNVSLNGSRSCYVTEDITKTFFVWCY